MSEIAELRTLEVRSLPVLRDMFGSRPRYRGFSFFPYFSIYAVLPLFISTSRAASPRGQLLITVSSQSNRRNIITSKDGAVGCGNLDVGVLSFYCKVFAHRSAATSRGPR